MEHCEIKIILSEKGKELANVGRFKYRFVGSGKKGEVLKWRCTKNHCTAMIYSGPDKTTVIRSSGLHNHEGISPHELEKQVFREKCKRRAEGSLSTQPLKLMRSELLNSSELSSVTPDDFKTVRKAIYYRRRKILPDLPKSLDEVFLQLNAMKTREEFQFQGQPFVHIPEDNGFVCVTTCTNLRFMTAPGGVDVFADGTLDYAPKYFEQLYTVHGYKNGCYLPLVYFFLCEKSVDAYKKVWTFLEDLCEKRVGTRFTLDKLHVDFEKAAHQATREVFENVRLIASTFHLGQLWRRKINSDPLLRKAYVKKNDELGDWLKSFFGLAFLSSRDVPEAFVELVSVCPDANVCTEFSDYIFNNYIDDGSPFPPSLWAEEPAFNPRTTNEIESFYETYNSQFYQAHPHIHLVIMVLQGTQAETETKMQSIEINRTNGLSKYDEEKIMFNIKAYEEYNQMKSSDNLLKYLLKAGNNYLGKPILEI